MNAPKKEGAPPGAKGFVFWTCRKKRKERGKGGGHKWTGPSFLLLGGTVYNKQFELIGL